MRTVLTDVSVRALKAPARGQYTVWDKSSPVGVRISQGGSRAGALYAVVRSIGDVQVLGL